MNGALAILADEFRNLWRRRGLVRPDGRPLHRYRFDDAEYECMRAALTACGRQSLSNGPGAALFVAYTAEWFRRGREGGHWDWIRPLRTLGIRYHHTGYCSDIAYSDVRNAAERGLRFWARPTPTDGRILFAVVRESGFPAAAVRDNQSIATWLKRAILTAERGFAPSEAVMMEGWRVGDTIAETLYETAGDLCAAIVGLRAEIGADAAAGEDPVARLDRLRPEWRNDLPFAVEEQDVRALVEQMVRVRATAAGGLGVARRVVKIDGGWKSMASIELRGELELSKFPRSVGAALRDAGRARIVPRPPLGGDLQPIASIEQWGDDGEEGRWEVRPLVARFEKDLGLDREFRLAIVTNERLLDEFVAPSGEGYADSVVALDPLDAVDPDAALAFEVLGASPTRSTRPWLALAVRTEALGNLTIDGERFDLGILGPDRAVVGFRGTATLLADGISLIWRAGCAQPSQCRLHFVGEVMRGVAGQVHLGMPAVWIEKEERFSQKRPETLNWRPHGRGRWRAFREGSPLGSIDVAVLDGDEVVAFATLSVVPQGFVASGDAARGLLTLRGLTGARVAARSAAPLAIECNADGVTVDLSGLAPGGTVHVELHWEASIILAMPNPATRTALLGPRGEPVAERTWLCLERLAGYRILSAQPQTLVFELRVAGASRTQITRRTMGDTPLGAYADEMEKLLGGTQALDAEVWISWPGSPDRAAQVRRWATDIDPFVPPAGGPMAAALGGLTRPALAAFSLCAPEAGVRTNVVGAPLESMASELRAELGAGPWLLFGKDSYGAPLRPRVVVDHRFAGGDHGLAATTSLQPAELRAAVQDGLLHRPGPLCEEDRLFLARLAAIARRERLPFTAIDPLKAVARAPSTAVRLLARCASFEQRHDLLALQRHLPFLWCGTPVATWIDAFVERRDHLAENMAEFGLGTVDATGRIAAALEEILDARPDLAGHVRATLLVLLATGGGATPPSAAGLLRRLSWTITEPIVDALRRSTTALISRHAGTARPPSDLRLADRVPNARVWWNGYEALWADVIAAPFAVAATAAGSADMDLDTSQACREAWLFDADHFESVVPLLVQAHGDGSMNIGRVTP